MDTKPPTDQALLAENAELRARLMEAEETLHAIRNGEVDALVVDAPNGHRLYTLQGVDAESSRFRGEILALIGEAVLAVDHDQRVTYVNPAAERLYGVSAAEVLGRRLSELYELRPVTQGHDRNMTPLRHEGAIWRIEQIQRTHDGRELQVEVSDAPLLDNAGQPSGRLSVIRDIAERTRAAQRLRESEARLRLILRQSPAGIVQADADGNMTLVNDRWCEMLGYPETELLGKRVIEVTHPSSVAATIEAVSRLAAGESVIQLEKTYCRKDGSAFSAQSNITAVRSPAGEFLGLIAVVLDISERLRVENDVREKSHFLQRITEVTPGVLYVFDLETQRSVFINRSVASLLGYSPEEIAAMGEEVVPRLMHPDDLPRFEPHMARVRAFADGEHADFEHRMLDRAGEWHWFHSHDTVFTRDAMGAARQLIGVATEITARKRAEETLRQNAALFSSLIAQAPMGTYVVDAEFRMRQVNAEAMPTFMSVQPVIGRGFQEVIEILWGPEVGGQIAGIFRHTLATGERYVSPPFTEQRHDLGIAQSYEWETQRVRLPDGQHGVVCYFHEVTERARATEALRASEQRMRLATEATQVGIWEWNVLTNQIRWDAQMFRIYGIAPTPDGFVNYTDWSGAVLPEDLAENEAILQDTLRRCGQSERTFRIRRRDDGACRHVAAVETVRMNAQGQAEWVVGTNLDMTDHTQKAEALQASEERFRVLADRLDHLVKERTDELVQSQGRLRALATELNLTEHRERKRLADELHDYLAQLLVLCRLNLAQMKRIGLSPEADEKVRETEEVLSKALLYSRSLMAELSPPILHDHGLTAGLLWLGEQMARRGLTVRVDTGGIGDVRPPDDRAVLLFQSVRELLLNALKYAECTEVVVRMELADGRLRIEVCDDGVGFDLVAADSYSPTAMSSKFGLFSIGERMMSLGGWFELTSSCGKGTTAALVMPLKTADSSELKVLSSGLSDNSALPSNSKLITQHSKLHQQDAKIRVLLVDDHAMVRQGLRSVLDSYADIEVVGEAWDGEEAVAEADRFHPAIVVMDINMPKMNGIEATARIKARYPEVIVIGMSVQAGGANEEAMKKAGASMLLTKEAVVEELYRAIRETLDLRLKGKVLSPAGE